jgi:hypothetical protein
MSANDDHEIPGASGIVITTRPSGERLMLPSSAFRPPS